MAVTKKQDNNNSKKDLGKKDPVKKDPGKKQLRKRGPDKEPLKKEVALSKDKRDTTKNLVKKDLPVKREKVNRVEQAQKFLRGALNELKKVHWPTRREIIIYTVVVLVAVVVVGMLIWIFDSLLSTVLKLIL